MCEEIKNHIDKKFHSLTVAKYTGEDDYSNLIDPDIRVTTPGSGGTAHDIPNLTTIITVIAMDSVQTNLQMIGRMRYIKGKDFTYVCMVNQDHKKHVMYQNKREKLLGPKLLSIRHAVYEKVLGG
jgi:hypothetical protein